MTAVLHSSAMRRLRDGLADLRVRSSTMPPPGRRTYPAGGSIPTSPRCVFASRPPTFEYLKELHADKEAPIEWHTKH